MKRLTAAALAVTGLIGSASAGTYGPLVSPQELSAILDKTNPVILDIRGDAYGEGHIPGAISAPYGLFRGPKSNPGQLLEAATYEERFEALGLNFEKPIVIVHEGDSGSNFGAAARVYWTLKSSGFTDLAILNGGKLAWESAGFPISTQAAVPIPSELDIVFSGQWTATTPEVAALAEDGDGAVLIDARFEEFYEGERKHNAAAKPGTVAGAINYPQTNFFGSDPALLSEKFDAAALKTELGISDGADVVSFCNTGHWAATSWFALSEVAEIQNVRLYPGSMVEYSNADQPMDNAPGLLRNLAKQLLNDG